eukprot:15448776-Alexandrium_andersonii.AAC.1
MEDFRQARTRNAGAWENWVRATHRGHNDPDHRPTVSIRLFIDGVRSGLGIAAWVEAHESDPANPVLRFRGLPRGWSVEELVEWTAQRVGVRPVGAW